MTKRQKRAAYLKAARLLASDDCCYCCDAVGYAVGHLGARVSGWKRAEFLELRQEIYDTFTDGSQSPEDLGSIWVDPYRLLISNRQADREPRILAMLLLAEINR